jgi:hypothetical protein
VAFKKEMAEEEARYQAACEARDATWKKQAVELWGRARRRAEEVYEDGYFAWKVKGARRLIAAWRWADKLQRATDEELRWAPNEMARSFALVRQQEADRYVKRCEAEEAEYCLRAGKTPHTRELLTSGYRNMPLGGIIIFSIVRFQFYAWYLVVKYHHEYVMTLYIFCDELMNNYTKIFILAPTYSTKIFIGRTVMTKHT